jgi:hypothetical protein
MSTAQKAIERHHLSIRRSDRWPLGLLDDARSRVQRDAQEKKGKATEEYEGLGRELRYTQQVVASELASWQEGRVEMGRKAVKEFARRMVVVEKARLESMRRAVRELGLGGTELELDDGSSRRTADPDDFNVDEAEVNRGAIEDVTDLEAVDPNGLVNGDVDVEEDQPLLGRHEGEE